MFQVKRVLLVAFLFAATGVIGVPTATADEPKDKTKVKKPEPPATEPGKTIIIQIDASKIPPEVLKDLIKLSQASQPTKPGAKPEPTKPGVKPEPAKPGTKSLKTISLSDAIAIAEKLTKGTVVKAEREDEDGQVEFELIVIDGKGGKSKVVLDGNGNVTKSEKGEDKDEKGKKK
jgi:uncharacterized membrane protein YkoI